MGIMDKVSNIFFKEEDDYDFEEVAEKKEVKEPVERNVWQEPEVKKTKKSQIVSIPTGGSQTMEMILIKAKSYDDIQNIAAQIKNKKVVIVNFEDLDTATSQRMVDFLSGAVFALDGVPKKVSHGTFVFSSSQVDLEGQIMDAGADDGFEPKFDVANLWK